MRQYSTDFGAWPKRLFVSPQKNFGATPPILCKAVSFELNMSYSERCQAWPFGTLTYLCSCNLFLPCKWQHFIFQRKEHFRFAVRRG